MSPTCSRVAIRSRALPPNGVDYQLAADSFLMLCALAQHETRFRDQVPARVAFEAAPRAAPADFPAGRVVAARRAAHHHAVGLVVKNRIVPAEPADGLAEPADDATDETAVRSCFSADVR